MVSAALPIPTVYRASWPVEHAGSIYGLPFFKYDRFMQAGCRNQFAMNPARLLRQWLTEKSMQSWWSGDACGTGNGYGMVPTIAFS
jgi:hypothetical protein